jgi:hypothetical protein
MKLRPAEKKAEMITPANTRETGYTLPFKVAIFSTINKVISANRNAQI